MGADMSELQLLDKKVADYKYKDLFKNLGTASSVSFEVSRDASPDEVVDLFFKDVLPDHTPSKADRKRFLKILKRSEQMPGEARMTTTVPKIFTQDGKTYVQQYYFPISEIKKLPEYGDFKLAESESKKEKKPKEPRQTVTQADITKKQQELLDEDKKPLTGAQKTARLAGGVALLELLGAVGKYYGPAQKRARQRIKELEDKRERGTLGDPEEARQEFTQTMAPVRAIAQQAGRQQEAVMAGMGETRSAAQLGRMDRQRAQAMGDTIRDVASQVDARKAQRAERDIKELDMLYAYQQENLDRTIDRLVAGLGMTASKFGEIYAAEAEMEPFDPIRMANRLIEADPKLSKEKALDLAIQMYRTRGTMITAERQLKAEQAKREGKSFTPFLLGLE